MKLNKLGKFAALCMAGCMLLGGCGAENPADEKTVTGNAADVSAEKSETRMDSENNTTEKNDMAAEDTAAETESAETETEGILATHLMQLRMHRKKMISVLSGRGAARRRQKK